MTVKTIYEDGVFRPMEKVELKDKTEVELDFRPYVPEEEDMELHRAHPERAQGRSHRPGARQVPPLTGFVDTSFFFALASPGDPDHERG